VILIADLFESAVDGNACVIHPGIESAELLDGVVGDALEILAAADVGDDVKRFAALGVVISLATADLQGCPLLRAALG